MRFQTKYLVNKETLEENELKITPLLAILTLLISSLTIQAAEKTQGNNYRFIDLDGDGFDDNMKDIDNDGIPDMSDNTTSPSTPKATTSIGTGIFSKVEAAPISVNLYTINSQRFASLKCCTLSLMQNRGGFGAADDFGPATGMNQGSGGGNCSGGICH